MRIVCGFNLLLLGLLLVSGCLFHKKPKSPEPIRFHEVRPVPVSTNAINTLVATNEAGWDVATNVPVVPGPAPVVIVSDPTNTTRPAPPTPRPALIDLSNGKMIVTPSWVTTATVTWVNGAAKFVVLTFPIGHLPAENQLMTLYRQGLKVGDVRATGPQKDNNVVADLLDGDAQLGDEVR